MPIDVVQQVSEQVGRLLSETVKVMKDYSPPSELTRNEYKNLTEGRLLALRDKYGYDKIRDWIMEQQAKDIILRG